MGYFNNQTGYPTDILSTRAIIKRGNYALIPPNGLVRNVIPRFENCDVTILSTPKLGATFVDYLVTLHDCGRNTKGFGGEELETFVYVIDGAITASADATDYPLTAGGYLYCPAGVTLRLENANGGQSSRLFLYKRRYQRIKGYEAHVVSNNVANLEKIHYEGMSEVILQDLLPKDLGFDMNMHILSFAPGASHGYIETHVQEHGAYILSGAGVYNLDNEWMPVKQGDYIFMGAYVQQAGYAVGQETFSYIYSRTATATSSRKRFAAKTKATCSRSAASFIYPNRLPIRIARATLAALRCRLSSPCDSAAASELRRGRMLNIASIPARAALPPVLHHAGQRDDRQAARPRQTSDAGQRLAAQRLAVDAPFAGDQQIGLRQRLLQAQRRHHDPMPGFSVAPRNTWQAIPMPPAAPPPATCRTSRPVLWRITSAYCVRPCSNCATIAAVAPFCGPNTAAARGPTSGLSTSQATSIRHCRRRASSVLRSIPLSVASSPPPHGSALPSGR